LTLTLYDSDAGVEFSDLLEIDTLELGKLPDDTDGTKLYDWARFIAAENEEELKVIAERNPTVGKAVVRLIELSADEKTRDVYERREKARRDADMHERWAMKKQALEIAKAMLSNGEPAEKISLYIGLTEEEIESLR
jgi:predicted transposase/invertase (TIGR01784 family)